MKQGVPRKSPEEYVAVGSELHGIDVLCTHESPLNIERTVGTPEHGKWLHESPGTKAIEDVIGMVRPKLVLSGHLSGPYTLGKLGDATCLRVDSSPAEKYFAMLDTGEGLVYIRHDWEAVSVVGGIFP